jgi:hypothetical protein
MKRDSMIGRPMILLFPVFLVIGFFLPGFFLARYFRQGLWPASAFLFSLPILFHCIFWLGVFHIPLTLWSALAALAIVTAGAALLARNSTPARNPTPPAKPKMQEPFSMAERLLIASACVVGAVLVMRSITAPLNGFDVNFRWDFLAQRILALHHFQFYPPVTPADFHDYFYPDAIAPMVSFSYWWLYVSAGQHLPALSCVLLAAQFAATLAFTYGTTAIVFSRRAALLAVGILAACPLFFNAIVMGQETGLTTLSIAAMLYFIVSAQPKSGSSAMIAAGIAASICPLSREYGWASLIAGAIVIFWRGHSRKQLALFLAVAAGVAAPWYIRTFLRSGNPFLSLRFLGFPVNPVHDGLMEYYRTVFGLSNWNGETFANLIQLLLLMTALPLALGFAGGFRKLRERGYLIVTALLFMAVWLQSAGYTNGGIEYSMRVMTPAMAALAVIAAGTLAAWAADANRYPLALAGILLFQLWTIVQGATYPIDFSAIPPGKWLHVALEPTMPGVEFLRHDQLLPAFPPGSRVLTDSATLHAAMLDNGIDVVPVWSPEVYFLFSESPEEATRHLRSLRIERIAFYPKSVNSAYLQSASPLYRELPQRWALAGELPGVMQLYQAPFR